MELPQNTPTAERSIQGISVMLPQPFVEGHTCTAQEAAVLNQTLAENLGNNLRKAVSELIAKTKEEMGEENYAPPKAAVQEMLDKYLPTYEFGVKRGGGGRIVDPVEAEAWSIAERLVKDAIRAKGGTIKSYEDKLEGLITRTLEKNPNIRKDAAEVVKRRQKSAAEVLDLDDLGN